MIVAFNEKKTFKKMNEKQLRFLRKKYHLKVYFVERLRDDENKRVESHGVTFVPLPTEFHTDYVVSETGEYLLEHHVKNEFAHLTNVQIIACYIEKIANWSYELDEYLSLFDDCTK